MCTNLPSLPGAIRHLYFMQQRGELDFRLHLELRVVNLALPSINILSFYPSDPLQIWVAIARTHGMNAPSLGALLIPGLLPSSSPGQAPSSCCLLPVPPMLPSHTSREVSAKQTHRPETLTQGIWPAPSKPAAPVPSSSPPLSLPGGPSRPQHPPSHT